MNRYYMVEDDPTKTRYMLAGIVVGYILCAVIGFSVGLMWPQIAARMGL